MVRLLGAYNWSAEALQSCKRIDRLFLSTEESSVRIGILISASAAIGDVS